MKALDNEIFNLIIVRKLIALLLIIGLLSACKKEDKTPPDIQLLGQDTVYLNLNDSWVEPGFVANDNKDGDITNKVIITGTVNTKLVNIYPLKYNVTDNAGNEAVKTRVVFVKADSLQGTYHVDATVEGTNQGNYSYTVTVNPGSAYNILKINNFVDFGNQVTLELNITGNTIVIPSQSPSGVNPGYEGTITGMGTYDGETKKITQLQYIMNYLNGGMDSGTATFNKN